MQCLGFFLKAFFIYQNWALKEKQNITELKIQQSELQQKQVIYLTPENTNLTSLNDKRGEHISWQAKSIKQRKGGQNNTRQTINIKFDKNKQNNSKLNLQMGSHPTPPFAVAGVFVWSRAQVLAFNNAHCIIDIF